MAKTASDVAGGIAALVSMRGKKVSLETTDGMQRTGTCTAISFQTFKLDGASVDMPHAIELNGEAGDEVMIARLATVKTG